MRSKKLQALKMHAAILMTACLLAACGSSSSSSSTSVASDGAEIAYDGMDGDYAYTDEYAMESSDDGDYANAASSDAADGKTLTDADSSYEQKLIRTYDYDLQTKDFEASMQFINESLDKYQGYMESSEIYGSTYPEAYLVLRIPTEHVNDFIGSVGSIGEITHQAVSTEDVTLTYYDISSRLESLHAQHDRLIELIEKAETLTDIAQLEDQLSDVEYEINSYQSRLKVYDNLVDYTTINLNLTAVAEITVVEQDTFWTKVTKRLSTNTRGLLWDLEELAINLIASLPYLVILIPLAVIIILVRKAIKKRRAAKAAKKEAGSGK